MTSPSTDRLMRRPEVERETGLSCSTIYRMIEEGRFSWPRRIGVRAVAWTTSELRLAKPVWPRPAPQAEPIFCAIWASVGGIQVNARTQYLSKMADKSTNSDPCHAHRCPFPDTLDDPRPLVKTRRSDIRHATPSAGCSLAGHPLLHRHAIVSMTSRRRAASSAGAWASIPNTWPNVCTFAM